MNIVKLHITSMHVFLNAEIIFLQSISDFLIMCVYVMSFTLKTLQFTVEMEKLMKVDVGSIISPVIWKDQMLRKM